ncbi:M48 family metallopeptidase [Psychroflexus sp. ALD_RP9]|uniref:M48 family metallopeptidase n=1 Tax=Psychroflexus sp. ALD_RP9 TaxID=2777186 RepID=UPI001A8FCEA5|nr:M48 family metallopeptidase [Psychroflexus sp. ALD_RP9]QSS97176.1 M48 family metallopeptidase [Psychroflexus sp. ALD_RP9]
MLNPETVFYIILGLILFNYCFDLILSLLNAKKFDDKLPPELVDVYDEVIYKNSQNYKRENFRFSILTNSFSTFLMIIFLFFNSFAYLHYHLTAIIERQVLVMLVFFGILFVANFLLNLPLNWYHNFVIEAKYDFNRTSLKTFWLDQLKSFFLTIIIGGLLLIAIYYLFYWFSVNFWWYAWVLISVLIVIINMFYTKLILPIFNKLSLLPDGKLRDSIENYAKSVNFNLSRIFVIDGSKRSTKANAFFSGLGSQKQVTLYDTLINDLTPREIVAVLAHEVGHYKHKHIIFNLVTSILSLGLSMYILSLFIVKPEVSQALGVQEPNFHIGLIAFGFIYSPVSFIISIITNLMSRHFEYQADAYAKKTFNENDLISALKKLNQKSLSNLTPHPWYVFFNYSHPTLLQRFRKLKANA